MGGLSIHLLGAFQVALNGQPVTGFESNKGRALLAYLAVEADRPHSRDTLAGLFWPDQTDEVARHNLRQALSNLRQVLPAAETESPFLHVTRQTIQLNPDSHYGLDVSTFTALITACEIHPHPCLFSCESCCQRLQQAETLYRGDFLAGFFGSDSVPFEEWMLLQREQQRHLALRVLGYLTEHYAQRRNYDRACHYARRQVALDPWREEACQQLMRLLARYGQYNAALAQYKACRETLAAELGVEPLPETTALYERIRAARSVIRRRLPGQTTPFIGRERELAAIVERLQNPACRLLTLVGPGGIGKTRLAIQAAAENTYEFLHGVCFVSLAAASSADLLVSTIAHALGIFFSGQATPKAQLLTYLRQKEMLLVLDNFEQLLAPPSPPQVREKQGGAELLAEILSAAPDIKILATSRERLSLQEEWLFETPELSFPPLEVLPPTTTDKLTMADNWVETMANYSAVQLFIQAVQRIQPNFAPTAQDYYFIGCLCHVLQGVPLGLELAASWGCLFSCCEIFSRTQADFDFLTSPCRNAADRHQSLRAVFDHSWRLLRVDEQAALRKLSVFRGRFGAGAAQAVADAAPTTLLALVNKSCLSRNQAGQYTLHVLLKQYLAEKLAACPSEFETTLARHCAYYADWLHQRQNAPKSNRQAETLPEIRAEFDDARAAWQWAVVHQNIELLSRMMEGIYLFCGTRGRYQEGQTLLAQAAQSILAMTAPNRPLLAQIWTRQADFYGSLGDDDQAQTLQRQSLEVWSAAPV